MLLHSTLKVFRKGVAADYSGTRKTDGIVSYMKKQALPAVSDVTAENHDEFKTADKVVLVAYVDESDSKTQKTFRDFADQYRDDYLFGLSTDAAAIAAANVKPPAVVMYKTFDEGRNDLEGKISSESLITFAKEHSVPLLDEISPDNFATYAEAGIPLAYIFVPANDPKREEIVKAIEPVAREHKGKINFVWIDSNKVRRGHSQRSRGRRTDCDHPRSSPTTPSRSTSRSRPGPRSPSRTSRP